MDKEKDARIELILEESEITILVSIESVFLGVVILI
jgi:hypothetical protein